MNLGIAELWSIRLPEAQRHLEEGLTLARRIERPYLEVGSLAHLAMAALLTGRPASVALQRSEEAVAIAETHGWATDPVASAAFAVAGQVLVRLGRFAEAERWLERAEDALHPQEPATELVLRISQGLLQMGRGRLERRSPPFEPASRCKRCSRASTCSPQRCGTAFCRSNSGWTKPPPDLPLSPACDTGRRPRRRTHHHRGRAPRRRQSTAVEELAPAIARQVTALRPAWAALEASLFDAAAREQLGDRRAAEESIERALDLAEPDGAILPFALVPVRDLLARHPVTAPLMPACSPPSWTCWRILAGRGCTPAGRAQRSRAARSQVPAQQPQGARDRIRTRPHRTRTHAPPPYLRQA